MMGRGVDDALGVGVGVGVATGPDGAAALALGAGSGVLAPDGRGVVVDPGFAVGLGVAFTGFGLGLAVGLGVAPGVGLTVGLGVGFAVGLAVGFGFGGAATTTAAGATAVSVHVVPPALRAKKLYGHVPAGSVRVPRNTTPPLKSVPVADRSLDVPLIRTRTHDGAAPVLSTTVTLNRYVVAVVPLPGRTVPSARISVGHALARTGGAKPPRDMVSQLVSASAQTRLIWVRRLSIRVNRVSVSSIGR
jgi:hypothetical protein